MSAPFRAALAAAAELLRTLPRDRGGLRDARALFAAFSNSHPGLSPRLVTDQKPAASGVEHDILLKHPDEGTVALTWVPDEGSPWSICYADHWAANFLFTVSSDTTASVTVQEALLYLKMSRDRYPDLMDKLIEQQLIAMSIEADPPPVTRMERRSAEDAFRAANGLTSAAALQRRLQEWGVPRARFNDVLDQAVQRSKHRERVTAPGIKPYFNTHRSEFDRLRFFQVSAPTKAIANRIRSSAQRSGLAAASLSLAIKANGLGIETRTDSCFARSFPRPLKSSIASRTLGPMQHEGRWCLFQVLGRVPARLDENTRNSIEQIVFDDWIRRKRENAKIDWHWL
jgi:putative peptide maturation system protein